MKGLLLKDFYLLTKYCRMIFIFVFVFLVCSPFFGSDYTLFIFYPCAIVSLIPMSLYSYDEREKWCDYSITLPVSKSQFVSAKYIIGLLCNLVMIFIVAIVQAFQMINTGVFTRSGYFSIIVSLLSICLIAPSILMPFIFKFGTEKGRIVYFIVIGSICALFGIFAANQMQFSSLLDGLNIIIIFLVSVGIYIASWLLSIHFYKKREL